MLHSYARTILFFLALCAFDIQAATPLYTLNGLSANLSADGTTELPASCMIANPCVFEELLIIRIADSDGTPPESTATGLQLDCDDFGTLIVELWGKDYNGAWSFAISYVIVEDNFEVCMNGTSDDRPVAILVNGLNLAMDGEGETTVHVNDLIVAYTIPAGSSEPDFAFSEDPADTTRTFDCNDASFVILEVFAIDGNPAPSFTTTYCSLTYGVSPCGSGGSCCGAYFSVYNGLSLNILEEKEAVIKAHEFVVSQSSPDLAFSFSPDPADTLRVIDCLDTEAPNNTVVIEIWATTSSGEVSIAETYILAQNEYNDFCNQVYTGPENGNACNAFDISEQIGNCYIYGTTINAFTQSFEPSPPISDCGTLNNWCYFPQNTVWYYFDAPASGSLNIYSEMLGTQLALWEADNCSQLTNGSAILVAASSNDEGLPAQLQGLNCLIPNKRYYLAVDAQDGATGSFRLIVEDANLPCLLGPNSTSCAEASTPSPENSVITWLDFFTPIGERVGSIANFGNPLGIIGFEYLYNDGPIRTDGQGTPYLDRNWSISVEEQPSTDILLRLYFTEAEFQSLRAASSEIETLDDLFLTRVPEGECGPYTDGEGLVYAQLEHGEMSTPGNYYIDFEIPGFSSFYITPESGLVITDVHSLPSEKEVVIYPNPAESFLQIVLPDHGASTYTAVITDFTGKAVVQEQVISGGQVSLGNLPSGVYILTLQHASGSISKRFVIR